MDLKYWNEKNVIVYKKNSLSILILFFQPSTFAVHPHDYYAGNTQSIDIPLIQQALIDGRVIQHAPPIKNFLRL
ncbi:hypothetical protein ACQKMD_01055 [Viridibacillus sp. NPDC096237]|uniref:hypothetical protein n=1 Tax=Viridibacillus sp. NPDC096237 TaxID=3390721 RepID=UPI003CFC2245